MLIHTKLADMCSSEGIFFKLLMCQKVDICQTFKKNLNASYSKILKTKVTIYLWIIRFPNDYESQTVYATPLLAKLIN